MFKRLSAVAAVAMSVSLVAATAGAQGFTNACGGNEFFSCVNLAVAGSNSGMTQMFTITNISNLAPANNSNSFFSLIGVGSTGTAPTSMGSSSSTFTTACKSSITGCGNSSNSYANGFNGQGFNTANFYGLDANSPAPTNGLHTGASVSFFLDFATANAATSFLNGLQLAVHDQGGLTDACGSSKVVFDANGRPTSQTSSPANAGSCNDGGMSTVPEPSSLALLGSGLFGLVPLVRRRKK